MNGTGEERVTVEWQGRHGSGEWDMRFEGILNQLERRHRESSSDRARAYYEGFFRAIACASCHGSRLQPASRAVRYVGDKTIDELHRLADPRVVRRG